LDIAVKFKKNIYIPFDSNHKTNLTSIGIYTQQIPKISLYMFRHSMGEVIKEYSQWLK